MKRYLILGVIGALIWCSASYAGPKEDAISYIHSQQNSDSSWGDITPWRDTADIADIMYSIEGPSTVSKHALDYLATYNGAVTDYQARAIALLHRGNRDIGALAAQLAALQQENGGFSINR